MCAIVLAVLGNAALVRAQPYEDRQWADEVLLVIRTHEIEPACRVASAPIRIYCRLPGFFLAGTKAKAFLQLRKAGIDAAVVDNEPWTQSYAVVAAQPSVFRGQSYSEVGAHVLFSDHSFDVIKAPEDAILSLRERGFSCVEIGRPAFGGVVENVSTHLPTHSFLQRNDDIAEMISRVSDSTITASIQALQNFETRHWSVPNRDSVFSWVRHRFLEAGVTDVVLDSFQYRGTWQSNVVATIPGSVNPSAEIIIGAHMDSQSSNVLLAPGADDNASGTAAIIEMARVLKLSNYQPSVTLKFVGFAAEEAGLIGSYHYAQNARTNNRDIKVMMNYDMIGHRNQSQPDRDVKIVWYSGSEAFSDLHKLMTTHYTNLTPVLTIEHQPHSDSWPFYLKNYNAVFVIEHDFNPYYHTPNDLLQYLDIPYAADITRAALAMALTLDAMPPSVAALQVLDRGDGHSLVVRWDSVFVPDFRQYKVYVGTAAGNYSVSYLQSGRERILTDLSPEVTYYVGVSIIDLAGNESLIVERSGVPLLVPLPPVGLTAENLGDGVRLVWRRNLELDLFGYNIFRASGSASSFVRINDHPHPDTVWVDSPLISGMYFYFVTAVDSSEHESAPSDTVHGIPGAVGVEGLADNRPRELKLHSNYPNPFNLQTHLRFSIPYTDVVTLKVYDVLGRQLATLLNKTLAAGTYSVVWDASQVSSGVYLGVLQAGGSLRTVRMVLVR